MSVAVPPTASRGSRLRAPLAVAALTASAVLALHLRDPHRSGAWGYCPFKLLTGLDCPLCGSLRAVSDLSNGQVAAAASSNLLLVLLVPAAVAGWLMWTRARWQDGDARPWRLGDRGGYAVLVVLVVFAVVRNTPWGAWLHS